MNFLKIIIKIILKKQHHNKEITNFAKIKQDLIPK